MVLPKEAILEVVLVVKISEEHKQAILKIIQDNLPHVRVLQSKMKDGEFGLEQETIYTPNV
jgi:hypothetical protein